MAHTHTHACAHTHTPLNCCTRCRGPHHAPSLSRWLLSQVPLVIQGISKTSPSSEAKSKQHLHPLGSTCSMAAVLSAGASRQVGDFRKLYGRAATPCLAQMTKDLCGSRFLFLTPETPFWSLCLTEGTSGTLAVSSLAQRAPSPRALMAIYPPSWRCSAFHFSDYHKD